MHMRHGQNHRTGNNAGRDDDHDLWDERSRGLETVDQIAHGPRGLTRGNRVVVRERNQQNLQVPPPPRKGSAHGVEGSGRSVPMFQCSVRENELHAMGWRRKWLEMWKERTRAVGCVRTLSTIMSREAPQSLRLYFRLIFVFERGFVSRPASNRLNTIHGRI